jgi:hypothetical protein
MGSKGKILKLDEGKEFKFADYVKAVERTYLQAKKG